MNNENIGQSGNQELEKKLSELRAKRKRSFIIAATCLVAAAIFPLLGIIIASIPAIIASIIFANLGWSAGREMKQSAKSSIVRDALAEVFGDCAYNPNGCIVEKRIKDAGLIDEWDGSYGINTRFDYTGNDLVTGRYKGREIELCDVEVVKITTETERDDDGKETERETTDTVFKGIWMICKLEKSLPATVRIREKADRAYLFKKIAGERVRTKSNVETENYVFNEQFQILTTDDHYAFYVLTPHFMERILAADKQAGGRTLLCFSGEWVHIAIHNGKDSFEIKKASDTGDIPALKRRIQGEVLYLTGVLDEFFRNERLFS